ncbi:MAG: shikimate dehydrogenase family protein [Candidatus Rifleibacteriota bacterium]
MSQVTALKNILDINGKTKIFAIAGDPVAHSSSPGLWNRAFSDLNYNAVYIPMRVSIQNLEKALSGLQATNVTGINLTMPHKIEAVKYCSQLHHPADCLGSINTLWFKKDGMHGYNTDATGFLELLKNNNKAESCRQALVLGAGGSARAVIWALEQYGIEKINQISRKKAERLGFLKKTTRFKNHSWHEQNFKYLVAGCDLIVNATPLGLKNNDRLGLLTDHLHADKLYIDLNYYLRSQLMADVRNSSCEVIDGRELLLLQAIESFSLMTGLQPSEKIMRSCLF